MSKTAWAILVKFGLTFVAAWLAFNPLPGSNLGWIALVALVGTVLNYLVGDLLVLPRFANIAASLGDGVMAGLIAYTAAIPGAGFKATARSLFAFGAIVAVAGYFSTNTCLAWRKWRLDDTAGAGETAPFRSGSREYSRCAKQPSGREDSRPV